MSAIRSTSPQPAAPGAGKPAKTMSIGVVLERLREEFPDVTVSKIRFLESEGLITPQRTASGYRRFTDADVERLRYILVTQRDNYLPLKVIREQLEAMDAGNVTPLAAHTHAPLVPVPKASSGLALSDAEVAQRAGVDAAAVASLISSGLITPDASGHFDQGSVEVAAAVASLAQFGLDERHLKPLRTAAARQADIIARVTEPVAKSRQSGAKEKANDLEQQLTALVVSLHAALVRNELKNLGA
ncbi:MerR family transcriptional regulator [Corynebacterium liangguodongii]|uniref:MerR family transcriptional regulator n=1 Tax=Corynebacterium liangguodongii TaxID=2079535 RepID=A0A2S0WDY5_9CORY|nr:MerR family transcriptional regulator [Corynebacterium liangguodongii]AWB83979.1 MerR family transcriptional regulator [Corynebacterium liangguodongii]PWB99990.1 MerR family transcriptional regulator [Corynebacterium liangguodongii]